MTGLKIAVEFTDLWRSLQTREINTMLAKNVSIELLEFFATYAKEFSDEFLGEGMDEEELQRRLPNLLIIGYLIRLLEERVD